MKAQKNYKMNGEAMLNPVGMPEGTLHIWADAGWRLMESLFLQGSD